MSVDSELVDLDEVFWQAFCGDAVDSVFEDEFGVIDVVPLRPHEQLAKVAHKDVARGLKGHKALETMPRAYYYFVLPRGSAASCPCPLCPCRWTRGQPERAVAAKAGRSCPRPAQCP